MGTNSLDQTFNEKMLLKRKKLKKLQILIKNCGVSDRDNF